MTRREEQRCQAAGCISMHTAETEYTDTFDGDRRKTVWACPEHAAFLGKRDLAAATLRWMRAHAAVEPALASLDAREPRVLGTPAADVHLKALQEYLDSYAVVENALSASNDPEAKASVAAMDEGVVSRIEGLLTMALSLRQPPDEEPDS